MAKNGLVTVIVIIVLVVLGVFLFTRERAVAPTSADLSDSVPRGTSVTDIGTDTEQTPPVTVSETVITYTDSGYTPNMVTVKVGDRVEFKNESTRDMWPASAMHPTHTVYPGSDIKKCGTAGESMMFDACRAVTTGGSYSFTFTNAGSWGFHDHLNVKHFGKITVE